MSDFIFISPGEECSLLLGRKIGQLLEAGDIIALWGELAAGKTLVTRGIAAGVGVSPEVRVTSPTFTIINEYSGRLHLFHLDLYRIAGADELQTFPWREALLGNGAAVIEWPGRLGRLLPEQRWDIEFTISGDQSRTIRIGCHGSKNLSRAAKWFGVLGALQTESACRESSGS